MPLDSLLATYLAVVLPRLKEHERDRMLAALEPPNAIDPETGVPFGWDEDDELAGFEQMVGGVN